MTDARTPFRQAAAKLREAADELEALDPKEGLSKALLRLAATIQRLKASLWMLDAAFEEMRGKPKIRH